jgi:hypothetical protein
MRASIGLALALTLGLAACGAAKVDADDTPPPKGSLVLDFESGPAAGRSASEYTNSGTARVDVVVSATGSAAVVSVTGPDGGRAVRFPSYTGETPAPAAVLVATSKDKAALSPGDGDFAFGASFTLDRESSGSDADNGDNLVQRGTFNDPGQFKIQLDKGVPSCRVAGSAGTVFVKADAAVKRGAWYSVTCSRSSSKVSLTLKKYGADDAETWRATGPTGDIELASEPLSVGGKVSNKGVPVASADQFSGAVDDVFFQIK